MTQLLFDVSFVQSILRVVKRISSSVSMISIVGLALALAAPVVQASTFTCASGDVQCLIIAINQANANGQPENTIQLKPGTYTLTNIDNNTDGPNGLPSITSTLTIHVAAHKTATITRASNALNFRLFHVAASGRLTLRGLTLSNGSSGVSGGGGLFNNGGVVTIANSTFISNAGLPGGGLVNNDGAVTIIGSVFDSNRAPGLFVPGSALANSGELTIIRSTFSNNVGDGAALATTNGVVRINRSRFSKNFAGHIVGGLYILGGVVLMTETTFDGNGADGAGAVYVASDSATLIVNDSAFVENIAQGSGSGAAIANLGTVQVTNTTFARNIASTFFPPSGIAIANFGTLSLTNSTLDENTVGLDVRFAAVIFGATDAKTFLQNTILTHNPSETSVQDCAGPITSLGNNLIGDTSGCNIVLQPTDLTGDAGLSAFTDNGTPGNGHFPLLPTSQAIDAANNKICPKKDQIGRLRKPHCDIGSIEFNPFTHHDLTPAVEEDLVQVVQ